MVTPFHSARQVIERAVKVLDQMPPYDTHKIGVVFVGAGQVRNGLFYSVILS